jgi:lipopolysaccharide transport system ATP-binding protein
LNSRFNSGDCHAVELKSVSKWYDIKSSNSFGFISKLFDSTGLQAGKKNRVSHTNLFYALDGVSLQIRQNTSIGIIGENGAGKSTLLQIIANTLTVSSGTLKVEGRVASLLELGSGFDPNFTGRENVILNASILGLSKNKIEGRMDSILNFAEIGKFIDRPVKSYSSGMSLRLAFSVIAHVEADILIIDEALAVGDAVFVQKCMNFIREFKKRGTLILVSHDLAAIQSLCSECIWLSRGKIMHSGLTTEVLKKYHSFVLSERNKKIDKTEKTCHRDSVLKTNRVVIKKVSLINDDNGQEILSIKGDENVALKVRFNTTQTLEDLVLGFIVRNRLGMDLFSQKVDLCDLENEASDSQDCDSLACFKFKMPRLAKGVYTIYTAIAECTLNGDIYHHTWSENSYVFESINTESFSGLFKIPMKNITFT